METYLSCAHKSPRASFFGLIGITAALVNLLYSKSTIDSSLYTAICLACFYRHNNTILWIRKNWEIQLLFVMSGHTLQRIG